MFGVDGKAMYYPNLMFAPLVRVLGAEPVYASHDLLAASSEVRHFIDREYLDSVVRNQDEFVPKLVEPSPFCDKVWGMRDDKNIRVVGMMKHRLYVTIYMGEERGWLQVKLQNVLVIDPLPVPLHISLKSLELYPDRDVERNNKFKALRIV